MLTIIKESDKKVSFVYTTQKPIVKGASADEFIHELAESVNGVLAQAEDRITGMDVRASWERLYSHARGLNNTSVPREEKQKKHEREMNFAYFAQYSEFIIPGIISEIYKKYGQDYISHCVSHGDMSASLYEKIIDSAWLYYCAKEEGNEEMMFACAKQLVAAQSNKALIETIMNEI